MKLAVASKNPVKIEAVKYAFETCFNGVIQVEGISVKSGVSDQPFGDDETLLGAKNRVENLMRNSGFDYYVGIEGGVEKSDNGIMAFAWVFIKNDMNSGMARTAGFFLPPKIAELLKQGLELGDADDIVFNKQNSKQKNGAIGLLSKDILSRKSLYEPAVIMALLPFINEELYPSS